MNPEDPDNPISGLLGDLLKVIGGGARGGSPWLDAARALAQGVATDGEVETNVDPIQRIKLEELSRVVELHVESATGLSIGEGRPYAFVPVSRGPWAHHALEGWRPLLDPMVGAMGNAPSPRLDALGGEELPDGLGALLGQFASTMGPIMLGLQVGSAAGHLARQALGQYALMLPWPPSRELLVVPENVAAFAADWSLDEDATLLWVCAHELTVQLVLDHAHVAARLHELLQSAIAESVATQKGIAERLGGLGGESLEQLMADPEALLADLLAPGQRATSDRLTAVVSALTGYVDHATSAIAQAIAGSAGSLSEAWYRYRVADHRGRQAAAALFGFDVGRAQVDRGAAFVRGVLDRAGEDGLARLVTEPQALPTPAELDAPGLWLERIDLPRDTGGAQ